MLTSKQRAYLTGLANSLDPVVQIGKNGVGPESVEAVEEAFNTRELLKGSIMKTVEEDPKQVASILAERSRSELVRVIGRKFILYKPFKKDPVIVLPRTKGE